MSDNITHPALINRQIINEDLNRVIIAGQGAGAIVTVGTAGGRGPGQPASNPTSHQLPPGCSVDERIFNRSGAGMFLLGQGSGAQAHLSESFAMAAVLQSQMPVKEQRQQLALERELQETKQAWDLERNQLIQVLAQRDLRINQQAKIIVHLQDILNQNAVSPGYDHTRTNVTCQCQVQRDKVNELTAASQRVPQLATSNTILPEPAKPKLAEAVSPLPKITVSEPGRTASASLPNKRVQRKEGLVKSIKIRLVAWFSPRGKAVRDGRAV